MSTVELVFNSNPTPRFQHLRSNPSLMPQVVRDYRILAGEDHRLVHRESDNFLRCRRHDITGLATNRLRVQVEATNGAPCAELMEIRVY